MANQSILGSLALGCVHQFSWPRRSSTGDYYQVCLRCGHEYAYDWHSMRRLSRKPNASVAKPLKAPRRVTRWITRARRLDLSGPLRYRRWGTDVWMDGELKNISKSGVLFTASAPIAEKTSLEIELDMPSEIAGGSGARPVRCSAEIIRIEDGEGGNLFGARIFGYEFVQDGIS